MNRAHSLAVYLHFRRPGASQNSSLTPKLLLAAWAPAVAAMTNRRFADKP